MQHEWSERLALEELTPGKGRGLTMARQEVASTLYLKLYLQVVWENQESSLQDSCWLHCSLDSGLVCVVLLCRDTSSKFKLDLAPVFSVKIQN
jgi:hypothetical protein